MYYFPVNINSDSKGDEIVKWSNGTISVSVEEILSQSQNKTKDAIRNYKVYFSGPGFMLSNLGSRLSETKAVFLAEHIAKCFGLKKCF